MLDLYSTGIHHKTHVSAFYGRKDQCALDGVLGMRKGPNTEYGRTGLALRLYPN